MNFNISKIISKLQKCYEKSSKYIFREDIKKEIYKIKFSALPKFDRKEEKLLYLLCNVKTNLDNKYIDFLKNITSIQNQFFKDKNLKNNKFLKWALMNWKNN